MDVLAQVGARSRTNIGNGQWNQDQPRNGSCRREQPRHRSVGAEAGAEDCARSDEGEQAQRDVRFARLEKERGRRCNQPDPANQAQQDKDEHGQRREHPVDGRIAMVAGRHREDPGRHHHREHVRCEMQTACSLQCHPQNREIPQVALLVLPASSRMSPSPVRKAFGAQVIGSTPRPVRK